MIGSVIGVGVLFSVLVVTLWSLVCNVNKYRWGGNSENRGVGAYYIGELRFLALIEVTIDDHMYKVSILKLLLHFTPTLFGLS